MKNTKSLSFIVIVFALCLQWIFFKFFFHFSDPVWTVTASGLAIFGAAYMLSWGAELAQFEIPQSLAIVLVALLAVLPEYAVDMYFAWMAGKDPQYIHYAAANMTGSNRLLIGLGWGAVVVAYFIKTKKGEVVLEEGNRVEILALTIATLYAFVIPTKHSLSPIDSVFFLLLFGWYLYRSAKGEHQEPEIEGPIEFIAHWPRAKRLAVTILFFLIAGITLLLAAEPFAEGILDLGKHWGVEEFLLVQWLAPLASESPEFIVAILFAIRNQPKAGLGTLISSKVNQWTLLVGMIPLVYSLSSGHLQSMPLDLRQTEEFLVTIAQSFFALVIIANLRFSITEALILLVLFVTQAFFTSSDSRIIFSVLYIALGLGWFLVVKDNRKQFLKTLQKIKH